MSNTASPNDPQLAPAPFNWRTHLRVHPAAELFPLMSELELKELAGDIKARGCLVEAITLWRQNENDDWKLLDGRNRLDAMAIAGMLEVNVHGRPCHVGHADTNFTVYTTYRSGGNPYAIALSLNVHRRHLNAEQKRELIANVLKLNPKKSNRHIAEQVKDDHKKVGDVRSKLEATGAIPQLKKTEGKDGKARPAKAKKKKSVPISAPAAEPEAKPASASAEVSLEQRRAEYAALDLNGGGAAAELGAAIERDWHEAEPVLEALTRHTPAQAAKVIPVSRVSLITEIVNWLIDVKDQLTTHPAGNGEAPVADPPIPDDDDIPDCLRRYVS